MRAERLQKAVFRSEAEEKKQDEDKSEVKIEAELADQSPLKKFFADCFRSIFEWSNDPKFKAELWDKLFGYLEKIPGEKRAKAEEVLLHKLKKREVLFEGVQNRGIITGIVEDALKATAQTMKKTVASNPKPEDEITSYYKGEIKNLAKSVGWAEDQQTQISEHIKQQLSEISSDRIEEAKELLKNAFQTAAEMLNDFEPDERQQIFLDLLQEHLSSLQSPRHRP